MSATAIERLPQSPARWQPLGVPLVLGLMHLPYLLRYFVALGRYDHYSFYPLAILTSGYLIYDRLDKDRFHWNWICTCLVVLDIALVSAAVVVRSPWPVWVGLLCGMTACCLAARDKGYRGSLIHAMLPLLVLLRPPFGADLQLIGWLQTTTTRAASRVLHQLGTAHFRSGNVLELTDKRLLVEEACSGIQSLFAVIFVALAIVALRRRRFVHGLMLLPFAFLWAAAFNILRVLTIAVAWTHYGVDLSTGTAHTILGYVMLALATFATFSADQFLFCFTAPMPQVSVRGFKGWIVGGWNRAFSPGLLTDEVPRQPVKPAPRFMRAWPVVASIAGVLVVGQVALGTGSRGRTSLTTLESFDRESLPAQLGEWRQDSYSTESRNAANSLGEFSNAWVYQYSNSSSAQVSCDHPFEGWHDLEVCYIGQGWSVEERNIVPDEKWPCVEVVLSKPTGAHAYLTYSLFDITGTPVTPPRSSLSASFVNRVIRKARLGGLNTAQTIQSQIFVETAEPIAEPQRAEVLEQHRSVRELLRSGYGKKR